MIIYGLIRIHRTSLDPAGWWQESYELGGVYHFVFLIPRCREKKVRILFYGFGNSVRFAWHARYLNVRGNKQKNTINLQLSKFSIEYVVVLRKGLRSFYFNS